MSFRMKNIGSISTRLPVNIKDYINMISNLNTESKKEQRSEQKTNYTIMEEKEENNFTKRLDYSDYLLKKLNEEFNQLKDSSNSKFEDLTSRILNHANENQKHLEKLNEKIENLEKIIYSLPFFKEEIQQEL
jgi:DNA-directed RNA polymerase specialized sigma subunit